MNAGTFVVVGLALVAVLFLTATITAIAPFIAVFCVVGAGLWLMTLNRSPNISDSTDQSLTKLTPKD